MNRTTITAITITIVATAVAAVSLMSNIEEAYAQPVFTAHAITQSSFTVNTPYPADETDQIKLYYRIPGDPFTVVNVHTVPHTVQGLDGYVYIVRMQVHHADGSKTHLTAPNGEKSIKLAMYEAPIQLPTPPPVTPPPVTPPPIIQPANFTAYVLVNENVQFNWTASLDESDTLDIMIRKLGESYQTVTVPTSSYAQSSYQITHSDFVFEEPENYMIRAVITDGDTGEKTRLMHDLKPYQKLMYVVPLVGP